MRVDGNEMNYLHQARILMVMNPRDTHSQAEPEYAAREPDLIISFDINTFTHNRDVIESLRKGDFIQFNATITQIAIKRVPHSEVQTMTKYHLNDEDSVHHIHALDLIRIRSDGADAVQSHIHWDGRYQFNTEMTDRDFN